jgi:outer membrane receptor for ferrienterochelin and colicins
MLWRARAAQILWLASAMSALGALTCWPCAASSDPNPDALASIDPLDEDLLLLDDPDDGLTLSGVTVQGASAQPDPVRAQSLDAQTLRARNAPNLAEAMRYTAGARVESGCQSCGFTQLRLNGMSGPYTLILIDSLPSFSGLAAVYGLEQLPVELIERVEVIKGGGSALYGPSAVAGVLNVHTRRPAQDFIRAHTQAEALAGGAFGYRLGADAGLIRGPHSLHLFTASHTRQALDRDNDGFSELAARDLLAAGFNASLGLWGSAALQLKAHLMQEQRRGGDVARIDSPPHDAELAEALDTQRVQAEARLLHQPTPWLGYALGYVFAHTARRSYYGGGGARAAQALDDLSRRPNLSPDERAALADARDARQAALGAYGKTRNPMHIADARAMLYPDAAGAHELILGAQAQVDQIDDRFIGYSRVINATYTTLGAFAHHTWRFATWAEYGAGLRVDKHSAVAQPVVSPRAALLLKPADGLRLRTSFGMGFRAPQAFDEDLHVQVVGGEPLLIVNAPNLGVERSYSGAQQVEWELTWAAQRMLRVSVNGYITHLTDAFALSPTPQADRGDVLLTRENLGAITSAGVEVEVSAQRDWLRLQAGWTWDRVRRDAPDAFGLRQPPRTPQHYGYVEARASVDGWTLQTGLELLGPMRLPLLAPDGTLRNDPTRQQTPWFADWSAQASYRFTPSDGLALTPSLGVRNLLDAYQRDLDRGPDRDSAYIYGPTLPRAVMIGLQAEL